MTPISRRTVPVLLAIATLVPIGTLGWLALRLIRQDREMEGQRRRESLEYAAGRVGLAVESRLAAIEEKLALGQGIRMTPEGLQATDGPAILFQPRPAAADKTDGVFAPIEVLEYQRHELSGAISQYRQLARSPDPVTRAGALVRLGRVLRNSGDLPGALHAYDGLFEMGAVNAGGQPAEMIALQASCRIFQQSGDEPRFRSEVARLQQALYTGRVPMDRATFALYRDLLQDWGGEAPPADAMARTEAAIGMWQSWRAGDLPVRGRQLLRPAGEPVLAVWTAAAGNPVAWFAAPAEMQALFVAPAATQQLTVSAFDTDGRPLFGPLSPASGVTLGPGEARLPFAVRLAFRTGSEADHQWSTRRNLLIGGLLFAFALMLAATYGLARTTTKEMALARQQSDFISAVSHEFRTPITSMRHLTELLATDSVRTEERKKQYYELLARETERLHRMVESLLSFGRMQAGSYAWTLEPADTASLVRGVVDEFCCDPQSAGREILCEVANDLPPIRADREALSRAVSNLLDNARKYSDPGTTIRVAAHRAPGSIHISVEDHGVGIPAGEQGRLFRKFARGSYARSAGIRGIGIGLALVKSVAEAHGGTVRLASEPGRGSTFTMVIPCHES